MNSIGSGKFVLLFFLIGFIGCISFSPVYSDDDQPLGEVGKFLEAMEELSKSEEKRKLRKAILTNDLKTAHKLLQDGLNPNEIEWDDEHNSIPLTLAAKADPDSPRMIKLLLKAGANPDATENGDRTALFLAALMGHYRSAGILLEGGANPNTKNSDGVSALQIAQYEKNYRTARLIQIYQEQYAKKPQANGGKAQLHQSEEGRQELLQKIRSDRPQKVQLRPEDHQVPIEAPFSPDDETDTLFYSSYAEEFFPVRQLFWEGASDSIYKAYRKSDKKVLKDVKKSDYKFATEIGPLGLMERGTIYLSTGDRKRAIDRLSWAEKIIKEDEEGDQGVGGAISDGITWLAEQATGRETLGSYQPAGFEKVLMLNYESIAYLLNGKRKAYNVGRRSINWQDQERKKFRQRIEKAKKKMKKKKEKKEEKKKEDSQFSLISGPVEKTLKAAFAQHEDIATDVPSAFVNPFGHYVAGMINEYDSYKANHRQRSLLDNAQISYEKGLELKPDAEVLKNAVKDLEDGELPPKNTQLVHVVGGKGFAPAKKTLKFAFRYEGRIIAYTLPIYEPFKTPIDEITVQTTDGQELTKLSTISNIESLILRYQQDNSDYRIFNLTTEIISNYFKQGLLKQMGKGGQLIGNFINEQMKNTDTRSWSSLPKHLMAARIHLDKDINKIKVVSRNDNGDVLASEIVDINDKYPDFVYTRAIKNQIKAENSQKLWMPYYQK